MFCSFSLTYLALLAERYTVDKPYPIEKGTRMANLLEMTNLIYFKSVKYASYNYEF